MDNFKTVLEVVRGIGGIIVLIMLAGEQAEGTSFKCFIATKLVGVLIGLIIVAISTLVINKIDD